VAESGSRLLSVVQPVTSPDPAETPATGPPAEPGLADVVTLQRRKAAEIDGGAEESFFLDTLCQFSRNLRCSHRSRGR
jgi:integrase/recombinase XerC